MISDIDVINVERLNLEILTLGAKSVFVKSVASKSEDVRRVVQETLKQFGRVHILVNNAGIATQRDR